MIRYKLKDRELQAAYEKCLKDFDHHLQIACEGFDDEEETVVLHHLCKMTDKPLIAWELTISKKEIEPVEVYDPKKWNSYPEVTPPEGVLMRIEGQYAKRPELEYYGALMYLEGAWHFSDTVEIVDNVIVERFRPWNDEESAK